MPEKSHSAQASMWLALFVQIIGQIFGVGQTPLIAKEWVKKNIIETLVPLLANSPLSFLAPYISSISVETWTIILSFFVIWVVGYFIMQQISGVAGIIIALIIGGLIIFWVMGGLDVYRPKLPIPIK